MILSGSTIKLIRNKGTKPAGMNRSIVIEPFTEEQLGPNSYDLRLAPELLVYEDIVLDMKQQPATSQILIPEDGFVLEPGKLYLGRTLEYTETHGLVPMLEGRSSVGRLGVQVHMTAGFGDTGFRGNWTLELSCIQPVRIYAGVRICQISYMMLDAVAGKQYSSHKYQDSREIVPSRLFMDFQKEQHGDNTGKQLGTAGTRTA